jgi:hypothetical protein
MHPGEQPRVVGAVTLSVGQPTAHLWMDPFHAGDRG